MEVHLRSIKLKDMGRPMSLDNIESVLVDVFQPAHFFIRAGMDLFWERRACAQVSWETCRGRLLPPAHTRHVKTFTSWNIYHVEDRCRSAEPILSLKLDAEAGQLHVVRAILTYVWEGYDAGHNVIESRETIRWLPELVGTIDFNLVPEDKALRAEISRLVFTAVVGTSRLPLTSLESPLPGFSLGHLAFFDLQSPPGPPMRSSLDLVLRGLWADLSWRELAKLLEAILRSAAPDDIPDLARLFAERFMARGGTPRRASGLACPITQAIPRLFRTMFNEVSLSPWTGFADNAQAFLQSLVDRQQIGREDQADFFAHLLCQLGRHLTAYDLVTFHHRGANYPDALLVDACLKVLLNLAERVPELFCGADESARKRRRALRQGWLLRTHYEGHLVPDAPTSPGENARVLPPPHVRVPEEQLLNLGKRRKRLYDGDALAVSPADKACTTLQQSLHDLRHPEELRELGLGVFIDRPLGAGKSQGEPDPTPLFSYLAFSRSIARQRLMALANRALEAGLSFDAAPLEAALENLPIKGLPVDAVQVSGSGLASLADVRRVAEDFLLLETLQPGPQELRRLFNFACLQGLEKILVVPIAKTPAGFPILAVFDDQMTKRIELTSNSSPDPPLS